MQVVRDNRGAEYYRWGKEMPFFFLRRGGDGAYMGVGKICSKQGAGERLILVAKLPKRRYLGRDGSEVLGIKEKQHVLKRGDGRLDNLIIWGC